ncbi:MAG: hypothetical protein QOD02_5802 [Mycobacterium sp.]|jgi:hypothetical protein|nr:hypothetical protein [Mycobacterium sp.]
MTKCSAAYTSTKAIANGYATSSGRQLRLTRRHRKIEIIAVNAACSEGIAATRFTLACPELTSALADCRWSVPQPRVEIRSTNWSAPGWLICIAPSSPPSGTPAALRYRHSGFDGPLAMSAAVQRAAAHGGAAGSTTYTATAANDSATNRRTNAAQSVRLYSHSTPATTYGRMKKDM